MKTAPKAQLDYSLAFAGLLQSVPEGLAGDISLVNRNLALTTAFINIGFRASPSGGSPYMDGGKTKLRDATMRHLLNRPRTLEFKKIAEDTGLNKFWLESFAKGMIAHPSVVRVETLYEYLTGREIHTP